MLQDVTIPDNEQPDILGEMLDAALATRPGPVRTSPYCEARQEAVDDLELAAEWQVSADALLADENQGLRMLARQRANVDTHTAWLESQLADARRKKHTAEARVVALERERDALIAERDTLAAKLDAAHARLAERENAALVAEPDATDVCAGFSAAALYRMYTLEKGISEERRRAVERLTARLNGAQIAADIGLDDAHEDDDATPATLGDKPRKVWTEDVKRAILTALVEVPRNLSEMRADGWMAEVPDRQFAACILEMSRTWQLMRPVPGAPEGTYELTPDGADSARAMLADADDDMPATLGDRRQQETRSIEWTPPTRSKPDAAA